MPRHKRPLTKHSLGTPYQVPTRPQRREESTRRSRRIARRFERMFSKELEQARQESPREPSVASEQDQVDEYGPNSPVSESDTIEATVDERWNWLTPVDNTGPSQSAQETGGRPSVIGTLAPTDTDRTENWQWFTNAMLNYQYSNPPTIRKNAPGTSTYQLGSVVGRNEPIDPNAGEEDENASVHSDATVVLQNATSPRRSGRIARRSEQNSSLTIRVRGNAPNNLEQSGRIDSDTDRESTATIPRPHTSVEWEERYSLRSRRGNEAMNHGQGR